MAVTTSSDPPVAEVRSDEVVDLRGHRLGDLVQALAGCRPEAAELAVGTGHDCRCLSPDDALDTLAQALVRLRPPERRRPPRARSA